MLNQISVYLINRPGVLAYFMERLSEAKIFIRALTVAETEEYGLLLLLVDQFDKCIDLLERGDYIYSVVEVIGIKVGDDNIGGVYKIAKLFGGKDVNIEFIYSTLIENEALIVLRVDNTDTAVELLKANGYQLFESK